MIKYAIIIIGLLLLVSSVSAVVYPQEYYDLKTKSDMVFSFTDYNINTTYYIYNAQSATYATALELRRQNILLEKQNSLLEEQVKAQWVEACYRPQYQYGSTMFGDYSAWIAECSNAGYHPVG